MKTIEGGSEKLLKIPYVTGFTGRIPGQDLPKFVTLKAGISI